MFERYLAHDEHIADVFRRHPVVLSKPALSWLAALAFSAVIGTLGPMVLPKRISDSVGAAVFILATLTMCIAIWRWSSARYVITNRRILLVEGILGKKVAALNLSRLSDSTYRRSLWGRVLGYGELHLDAGGEHGGPAVLRWIPRPDEVYRMVAASGPEPRERADDRLVDVGRLQDEDTGPLPRLVL